MLIKGRSVWFGYNRIGLVSNVFGKLLERNSLPQLLREAQLQNGVEYIELRQHFLGHPYEDKNGVIDAASIGKLVQNFPDIEFNIAIQIPYLSGSVTDKDGSFLRGVETAFKIGQITNKKPHLRMVDPQTSSDTIKKMINSTCDNIDRMAKALSDINGILSIENSPQRDMWQNIWHIINTVRQRRDNIKLCYDPVNVTVSDKIAGEELARLSPTSVDSTALPWKSDDISMFHVKQIKGKILPVVSEGEVDWTLQLKQLKSIGYRGPICLEIAPTELVFDNIKSSLNYVNQLDLNPSNL